jgi:hypothetical protein|tara:strand:+ start:77 stop:505 length:429 start_codon:yes stop_codon:yes gene_type:complete
MIKYELLCKNCKTTFDSWFSSSTEYEKLKKKNFLNCYMCNSLSVEKNLMSPTVFRSITNKRNDEKSEQYNEIKKKLLEYQQFINKNFEYVGENFVNEARSMSYKNKRASKGIYGTATKEDLKELKEEGIEAEIIPWIKDNLN